LTAAGPLRALAALALGFLALAGAAGAQDATSFQPRCIVATLDNAPHAICETGAIAGGRVMHVRYQKEGATGVAEANFLSFTSVGKASSVLAVIDRGDRRRQRVVSLASGDAARLIEAARVAGPNNRFGVGQLADRYETLVPIGASRDEVARATTGMRADGAIGDSGRLLIDALRQLTLAQSERLVLLLASDGKPEDRAYGRDDVVKALRDAKVVAVTVAFRERPDAPGPEIAALRRLAEDTGGLFFDVGSQSGRLEDAAVTRFAQFVGSGGTATFPLNRVDPRGRYLLTLEFENGRAVTGAFFADVPAGSGAPASPPPAAPAPRAAPGPATVTNTPAGTPPPAAGARPQPGSTELPGLMDRSGLDNLADWFSAEWRQRPTLVIGLPAGALLIAAGVAWLAVRRKRRKPILAWLELADQNRTRVPVKATAVRIGRHSENDIRFENRSVHRYHAILTRDLASGRFVISDVSKDLEHSNGVLVNGEMSLKSVLADGDTVELGEVKFRFLYP
jgi:hypothetical protein